MIDKPVVQPRSLTNDSLLGESHALWYPSTLDIVSRALHLDAERPDLAEKAADKLTAISDGGSPMDAYEVYQEIHAAFPEFQELIDEVTLSGHFNTSILFGVAGGAAIVQALVLAGVITTAGFGLFGCSVLGALLGSVFISMMSSRKEIGQAKLALIGISVSALSVSVSVGILVHSRVFTQQSLVFISGSFANRGWHEIISSLPFILIGMVLAAGVSGRLNILALGDEIASNLGGSPERTRIIAIASAAILSGCAVAIGGLVGFEGPGGVQ